MRHYFHPYIFILLIVCLCLSALFILGSMGERNLENKYNYTVHYNNGKWSQEEYTNGFELLPGNSSVRYVNQKGDTIFRSGTFSIERNNHTQK